MTLQCIHLESPSIDSVSNRLHFRQAFEACRQETLNLVAAVPSSLFKRQVHPAFSPISWHIGHIAHTESFWILECLAGQSCKFSQYERMFLSDGSLKSERENIPDLSEILIYLTEVRTLTLSYLDEADFSNQSRLWYWLLQHEAQHAETIAIVMALHDLQSSASQLTIVKPTVQPKTWAAAGNLYISAGYFTQGNDEVIALDNERSAHSVWLDEYWIDSHLVTYGQYRQFIEAGCYQQPQWWTVEGWQWQSAIKLEAPLYWSEAAGLDCQPVCGVSWYEAAAYARFVGKRLPTESEWAKAAAQDATGSMLGKVWEWTDTWFSPYPKFRAFPYVGYSRTYFDCAHRVLRGGSWATPKWALRRSFRNWYHPHRREMFAGFRCAFS